jgi:hypothetical protein
MDSGNRWVWKSMIIATTYSIKNRAWHAEPSYVKLKSSDSYFIFGSLKMVTANWTIQLAVKEENR